MTQKFSDNARALLMGTISAVATSLTVEAAKADLFPVGTTTDWLTPGDWFKVTLQDSAGNIEIVKVGTRTSGSGVLGNLLRGQDGTTALAFTAGSAVIQSVTKADVENALAGIFAADVAIGRDASVARDLVVTRKITQGGVEGRVTPVGGIIMWSGTIATVPAGWALCDGTNGTPDMRDKFVIGARQDDGGPAVAKTNVTGALTQTGGTKDAAVLQHNHTATFTGTALGNHNHSVSDPGHSHGVLINTSGPSGGGDSGANHAGGPSFSTTSNGTNISLGAASAGTPAGTVAVANAGAGDGTNANLPPYYAVAFIMCKAAV